MSDVREAIVASYAEWTALSALRSGAPIKSRRDVYAALRKVEFEFLFDEARGSLDSKGFDDWHEQQVSGLIAREPRLNVGWAAKIINVYLKTRAYVGGKGRPGLAEVIHPPIDGGLWDGFESHFVGDTKLLAETNCVRRIKDINDYDCYRRIIDGCRTAASSLKCELIEVEQLWTGTEYRDLVS